jgi:hypothetical protein
MFVIEERKSTGVATVKQVMAAHDVRQASMRTKFTMNALFETSSRIIPQITEAKCAIIRESVASGAALTGAYLAMNLATALIASFGLMENSSVSSSARC